MIGIGTSGFSYDDWEPFPYPRGTPKSRMFDCYCEWFNAVEINATFYHVPPPEMMRGLVRRAAGRLMFSAKMSERVTHYGELDSRTVARFLRAMESGMETGVLKTVLFQFPFRFHHTQENRTWIVRAFEEFRTLPLVVEIRHDSWQTRDGISFFRDHGVSLCILDMPRTSRLPRTIPELTGPIAYFRFHGRNAAQWFGNAYPGAPFDYLYNHEELNAWVEPIKKLKQKAQTTLAFFNNHVRAQAPFNALHLSTQLNGSARSNMDLEEVEWHWRFVP